MLMIPYGQINFKKSGLRFHQVCFGLVHRIPFKMAQMMAQWRERSHQRGLGSILAWRPM